MKYLQVNDTHVTLYLHTVLTYLKPVSVICHLIDWLYLPVWAIKVQIICITNVGMGTNGKYWFHRFMFATCVKISIFPHSPVHRLVDWIVWQTIASKLASKLGCIQETRSIFKQDNNRGVWKLLRCVSWLNCTGTTSQNHKVKTNNTPNEPINGQGETFCPAEG